MISNEFGFNSTQSKSSKDNEGMLLIKYSSIRRNEADFDFWKISPVFLQSNDYNLFKNVQYSIITNIYWPRPQRTARRIRDVEQPRKEEAIKGAGVHETFMCS